jgi:hypothetical protein
MAAEPKKPVKKPAKKVEDETVPKSVQRSGRAVRKEPKSSFAERTRMQQPWLNEDGSQVTGQEE